MQREEVVINERDARFDRAKERRRVRVEEEKNSCGVLWRRRYECECCGLFMAVWGMRMNG